MSKQAAGQHEIFLSVVPEELRPTLKLWLDSKLGRTETTTVDEDPRNDRVRYALMNRR